MSGFDRLEVINYAAFSTKPSFGAVENIKIEPIRDKCFDKPYGVSIKAELSGEEQQQFTSISNQVLTREERPKYDIRLASSLQKDINNPQTGASLIEVQAYPTSGLCFLNQNLNPGTDFEAPMLLGRSLYLNIPCWEKFKVVMQFLKHPEVQRNTDKLSDNEKAMLNEAIVQSAKRLNASA
ncbi:MAG: hypothetical protein VKJ06_04185 [Vampirovibrionales bacterium]|nr:hypothetical protein [Vampirovibrionales bacterium]